MWRSLRIAAMGIVLGLVLLLGIAVPAHAADITEYTKGLDGPVSVEEETGNDVYTSVSDFTHLYDSQNYHLNYNWSIDDLTKVADGDTAIITVPTNASPSPAYFPVRAKDANKTVVGNVTINPGESFGTIKFNGELAQSNVGRTGSLQINAVGMDKKASTGGESYIINKNGWVATSDYSNFLPTKVTWNIVFNPDDKDMGDVTLNDTIGPLQTYIVDSLSAKDEAGNAVTPDVTLSGSTLKMVFHNVTSKIEMTYLTSVDTNEITGQTTGIFSNKVDLSSTSGDSGSASTGSGSDAGGPIDANSRKNAHWGGSAILDSDYVGGFDLTKIALGDSSQTLSGATYDVQKLTTDGTWKVVQTGLATDSNGLLDDPLLNVGSYRVIETKAPDGYLLNPDPISVTIASDDSPQIHVLSQTDSPNAATLTKTDAASGTVVKGATYDLEDANGNVVREGVTTDDQGQVTFTKLKPGTYYFVEKSSPKEYEINTKKVPVTISNTDTAVVNVTQKDQPVTSSSSSTASSSSSSTISGSSSTSGSTSSSKTTSSSKPNKVNSTSSSSSSTNSGKNANGAIAATSSSHGPKAGSSAAKPKGLKRYLPKTNEQKSLAAMIIGLAIFGISLSLWEWNRAWLRSLKH